MSMVRFVAGREVHWVDPEGIRDIKMIVLDNERVEMTFMLTGNNGDSIYVNFYDAAQAILAVQAMQLPYDPSDFCRQPPAPPEPQRAPPRRATRMPAPTPPAPPQLAEDGITTYIPSPAALSEAARTWRVVATNPQTGTVTMGRDIPDDDSPF